MPSSSAAASSCSSSLSSESSACSSTSCSSELVALVLVGVVVVVMFVNAGIGGRVGCGEDAILRIARGIVILRFGDVFGQRRGFFFRQIHGG